MRDDGDGDDDDDDDVNDDDGEAWGPAGEDIVSQGQSSQIYGKNERNSKEIYVYSCINNPEDAAVRDIQNTKTLNTKY